MRLTLPASVPASSGLTPTSRSLSNVSVAVFVLGSCHLEIPLSSRGTTWLGPIPVVYGSIQLSDIVGFTLLAMDLVNLISQFLSRSWARPSSSTSMLSESHSDAFPRSFAHSNRSPSLLNVLLLVSNFAHSGSSASLRSLAHCKSQFLHVASRVSIPWFWSLLFPCPGTPLSSKSPGRSNALLLTLFSSRVGTSSRLQFGAEGTREAPEVHLDFFEKF